MKIKIISSLFCLGCLVTSVGYGQTNPKQTLSTEKDSLSYALGVDVAKTLKSSEFEITLPLLLQGLEAAYSGTSVLMGQEESSEVIKKSIQALMDKRNANLREPGEAYLNNLKGNPNIHATAEGLLYEVLIPGEGKKPKSDDDVEVHYAGYLIDGTKFDSSYDRGEPIVLNLDRVIQGWTIGLPLMNEGSKYKFYIPYQLGYGERGSGRIPPYSTLVFEIELLNVIAKDGTPPAGEI